MARKVQWVDNARTAVGIGDRTALLERAFAATPHNLQLRRRLCQAYQEAGAHDEACAVAEGFEADPVIALNAGIAHIGRREHDRALALLHHAAASDLPAAERALIGLYSSIGDDKRASQAARSYLSRHPGDAQTIYQQAGRMLARRDTAALRELVASHWDHLCLRPLLTDFATQADICDGRADMRAVLETYSAQIARRTLAPAAGTMRDFCRSLAEELRDHPNLTHKTFGNATLEGRRVTRLHANPPKHVASLIAMLRAAVEEHLRANPQVLVASEAEGDAEPALMLNLWGVILTRQGRQGWHAHPAAVLSGVFYVDVPPLGQGAGAQEGAGDHAGWLLFGFPFAPPDRQQGAAIPVRPRAGEVVLFPGHIPHRTLPHTGAGERISIAFDVVRAT